MRPIIPPARFVRSLSESELQELHRLYRTTHSADVRTRCHIILLSAQHRTVAEIAALLFFGEDTVLYWLNRYEAHSLAGLSDRPRSGRPPKAGRQRQSEPPGRSERHTAAPAD